MLTIKLQAKGENPINPFKHVDLSGLRSIESCIIHKIHLIIYQNEQKPYKTQ